MTAPFLGLIDVDIWGSTPVSATNVERPFDWMSTLIVIDKNGDTPMTAMMGQLPASPVNGNYYEWWTKRFPAQTILANGAYTTETSIIFKDSASADAATYVRNGDLLLHQRSGEVMRVTVQSQSGAIGVSRNFDGGANASITDGDTFLLMSNAHGTGSRVPSGKATAPFRTYNRTWIPKVTLEETRSALQTALKWAPGGNYDELKREALQRFALNNEWQCLFGPRVDPTIDENGRQLYSTGGLFDGCLYSTSAATFILDSNVKIITDANGVMGKEEFDLYIQNLKKSGSSKYHLCLCGGGFMTAFQQYVESQGFRILDMDSTMTYGYNVRTWNSPWGRVDFLVHPLLWNDDLMTYWGLFIAPNTQKPMRRRVVQPVSFEQNAQDRDEDLRRDYFYGEYGFEWPEADVHGMIRGSYTTKGWQSFAA